MYVLSKLQRMCLEEENDIKRILSKYFIINANKNISLQKCIVDTGISKSAIYGFFSEAGFKSFRSFLRVVQEEMNLKEYYIRNADYSNLKDFHFDDSVIYKLINKVRYADNVYFYGNQNEINLFQDLILLLIKYKYNARNLNVWNIEIANHMLDSLKENDVLVVVDSKNKLDDLFDNSVVNPNVIDFYKINDASYNKFFIGKSVSEKTNYFHFDIIPIEKRFGDNSDIGILLLIKYMSFVLKRG